MASSAGTQPQGIALMVASSLFACTGQLLWKLGADGRPGLVAGGFVLYALGAVLMLAAYRFGELSVLQPILGLSYVLSLAMGAFWLHEQVTWCRGLGVAVVLAGVILVARGQSRTEA